MADIFNDGYTVVEDLISSNALYTMAYWNDSYNFPARGYDKECNYYTNPEPGVKLAVYWTHLLNEHSKVIEMRIKMDPYIATLMNDPIFYAAEVRVTVAQHDPLPPLPSFPHNMVAFNDQIDNAICYSAFIPMTGFERTVIPAFLSGSHRKVWEIDKCLGGEYTEKFNNEYVTPKLNYGDAIIYDSRTLHSMVSTGANAASYGLILTYVEKHMVPKVMSAQAISFF